MKRTTDYGMPHMYVLLQDLEKPRNKDKIKTLQALGHLLSSNYFEMKDEFHKLGGVPIILKYLDEDDWNIAGNALHILGFSILQSTENQMQLTTEHMFKIILKNLKQGTLNHKKGSMFLIASIVEGNVPGQILVRESGCLYELIRLFHETIQQTAKEEEQSQCLYFLCTAIKMCVHNPQNCENQHQTSLIIPKAITFLDSWFHQAFNTYLTECVETLVPMLVNIILDNPTNQLSFATYSGIQTLVIGLNTLESLQEAPLSIESTKVKLICLLDAAICGNVINGEEAALLGVIPLLLKMLQTFKDQHKFSLLVALTHLVESSSKNKEEFLQANGITAVVLATVSLKADSQIMVAANCLLKFCATGVLEDKCKIFEDRKQRNIKDHETGINKGNRQTTKQSITEELALADFRSGKKENNDDNEAFDDRLQGKVRQCEISNDQNNSIQTREQTITVEPTAHGFNSMKYYYFNNEDNPTKHMNKEGHACDLVRSNSESWFLLNQNEEKTLQERKRESFINDNTKGQSRFHYMNLHTQTGKTAKQVDIDVNNRYMIKDNSDYCSVLCSQRRDKHIPETSENVCIYNTTRKLTNNTLQHYRVPLQKDYVPQEDAQTQVDQQYYTSSNMEIHLNQHHETCVPQASERTCIYSTMKEPMSNSHLDFRLQLQENHTSQEDISSQTIQQQYPSATKGIQLNEVNHPVNTFQNPLVYLPNVSKPCNRSHSPPCSEMSHSTCQEEIKLQEYSSNTKEFHHSEVNGSVNTSQIPSVHTPNIRKSSNTPYSLPHSNMSHNECQKQLNKQQCNSNTKEYHTKELNNSVNTFQIPVLHIPNNSKSSNAHYCLSFSKMTHNTHQKQRNQERCASKIQELNPNVVSDSLKTLKNPSYHTPNVRNSSKAHYCLANSKMSHNICRKKINLQQCGLETKDNHPNEEDGSMNTFKIPILPTTSVMRSSKAHFSSSCSDTCQKEEEQQAKILLRHSTDRIPSAKQSLRSYLSHTIQTPINMAKRYFKSMFHRNSEMTFNSTEKNETEQDFKIPAHVAEEDTLHGEFQESKSTAVDEITHLMEDTNGGCPQHENSISSPVINQDKESNVSVEKMQCSQSCSVSSVIQKDPENKLKKNAYTCVRKAVTPSSCDRTLHIGSLIRHRRMNSQSSSRLILRYSKEELTNLVAGVAKYGLDFKAIRRAYRFHSKRTSRDLYLKWRSSFISSKRDFKSCQEMVNKEDLNMKLNVDTGAL